MLSLNLRFPKTSIHRRLLRHPLLRHTHVQPKSHLVITSKNRDHYKFNHRIRLVHLLHLCQERDMCLV